MKNRNKKRSVVVGDTARCMIDAGAWNVPGLGRFNRRRHITSTFSVGYRE